jgi:hypothetical protein
MPETVPPTIIRALHCGFSTCSPASCRPFTYFAAHYAYSFLETLISPSSPNAAIELYEFFNHTSINLRNLWLKQLFAKIPYPPQNAQFSSPQTCPACLPQNVVIWGLSSRSEAQTPECLPATPYGGPICVKPVSVSQCQKSPCQSVSMLIRV